MLVAIPQKLPYSHAQSLGVMMLLYSLCVALTGTHWGAQHSITLCLEERVAEDAVASFCFRCLHLYCKISGGLLALGLTGVLNL